jgi:hypothetical protein
LTKPLSFETQLFRTCPSRIRSSRTWSSFFKQLRVLSTKSSLILDFCRCQFRQHDMSSFLIQQKYMCSFFCTCSLALKYFWPKKFHQHEQFLHQKAQILIVSTKKQRAKLTYDKNFSKILVKLTAGLHLRLIHHQVNKKCRRYCNFHLKFSQFLLYPEFEIFS